MRPQRDRCKLGAVWPHADLAIPLKQLDSPMFGDEESTVFVRILIVSALLVAQLLKSRAAHIRPAKGRIERKRFGVTDIVPPTEKSGLRSMILPTAGESQGTSSKRS